MLYCAFVFSERQKHSTTNPHPLRLIAKEVIKRQGKLYNCLIDFQKAFDLVWHQGLWAVLNNMMVPKKLVTTIKTLYEHPQVAVRSGETIGDWLKIRIGSRQRDPLSPLLFTALLEKVTGEDRM